MRTPVKGIALMGNRYKYGGVTLSPYNELFIAVNECNKLVCYDLMADAIMWSANALGYAPFCEVKAHCYMNSAAYNPSIIMLLMNGEVWRKDLVTFEEQLWGNTGTQYPECRGGSGIEYDSDTLVVTFPQFNMIRRLSLGTLQPIAEYSTGVPTESPYPPAAISKDHIHNRWVAIDPVKGDLVYLDTDFKEIGRERYTYGIYNRCFDGDIAWSKTALDSNPGVDFFVACVDKEMYLYGEPWYTMWEVNDLTGTAVEIESLVLDNVEVNENVIKHLRLDNMTDMQRNALTISVTNDPTISADDRVWIAESPAGPWLKTLELGDISGKSSSEFFVRFHPQYGIELGTFAVEFVIDYTKLP